MLVKHKGIASLLKDSGTPATNTHRVSPRTDAGSRSQTNLLRIHKAKRLVEIIGKYGRPRWDWVWKHKAPLAAWAAMTAFLANPDRS